jgi:hypothetical protein
MPHGQRCALCTRPAAVWDHHPTTRRQLIAAGVADPDAPYRLRPLCRSCHSLVTVEHDGGFGRPVTRRLTP